MTGDNYDIDRVKSDIIQTLLFRYVKELCNKFNGNIIRIDDSDMSNDTEMYIFIDTKIKEDDFNNYDMFELYLNDFKSECDEFIELLDKSIPFEHLNMSYIYMVNCCELHFRIKELDF